MDISAIRIHCIKCNEPQQLKIDQFDKRQFTNCKECGAKFNVYGVYLSFYNEIPIAKQIVDALTTEIGVNYLVESPDASDKENIEYFLKENQFQSLLKDIVFDTVIFGNSFIEKKLQGEKVILQRIDPTTIEVETSWQKGEGKGFIIGIEKLIQHLPEHLDISNENLIHFYGGIPREPLGFSVYGFWFHTWYLLKFAPNKSLWKYARNEVVIGSGVPLFIIDTTIKVPPFFRIDAMTLFNLVFKDAEKELHPQSKERFFHLSLNAPSHSRIIPASNFKISHRS